MVMSMDDQTMSSPVDQSFKQQDSLDEEQNEDEQSKGSNQTIITQSAEHHHHQQPQHDQQQEQLQTTAVGQKEDDEDEQPIESEAPSAMQLSRESSVDEGGRKSMQIDDEEKDLPAPQADLIVSKMKEIVDGPRKGDHDERISSSQQQMKSSDDSFQNNQNEETTSKASADSGTQQKRTRRLHCSRHHGYHPHPHHHHHHHHPHHHHHHHHRQSVSETRVDVDEQQTNQITQSSQHQSSSHPHQHHHHHHHHRHVGQHPRNRHHHQHQHHQHLQQHQQRDTTSRDDKQNISSTQIDSSSSATVAAPATQQPQDNSPEHCQTNPDQPTERTRSSEHIEQQRADTLVACSEVTAEKGQIVHEPHHHHHYHHNHRCHHRHKKRLVLDTSSAEHKSQQELISSDPSQRTPTSAQTYPHHHHHHHQHQHHASGEALSSALESQQQQSTICKPHHHHHHRHNHRIHRHHHHHHHGHHHHHHHRHQNHTTSKQRLRRQVGSSKTNLDDQSNQENIKDSVESGVDKCESSQASKLEHSQHTTANKSDSDTCNESKSRNGTELMSKAVQDNDSMMNSSNQMNLDHEDDENANAGAMKSRPNEDQDGVVKMEMSPNSDGRQSRLVYDFEHLVDSTASDSNLITSIEVVPLSGSSKGRLSTIEATAVGQRNESVATEDGSAPRVARQPMQDIQQLQQELVFTQGTSGEGNNNGGGQMTKRKSSSHNFNDNRETQKENHDVRENNSVEKHDKLIRQTSSNGSKKSEKGEQARGSAAGNNESSNRQQINEFPSVGSGTYRQSGQASRQVIESNVQASRRCRLCWCCCCPCSSLSSRPPTARTETTKAMSEPSNSPSNTKCPSLPSVSLDEIRAWGDSFDRLMKCTAGRKVFQDFLRCEYSEENILFWSACEELKAERDSKNIAAKARDIYEDYISILSSKEVSLDSRVREVINNNIKKPTSNIFDEAQLQIYTLMHRDSYPRFINSSMYKKLAQLQPSSRKSSS